MDKTMVLENTTAHVQEVFGGERSGHDWLHIKRVMNNSETIAVEEKADIFVVKLGALLHDIADHKFHNGDDTVGPAQAREWLEKVGADSPTVEAVAHIVAHVSFKGANVENKMESLEGKIVQDADRLDAIGAIGIARCFVYSGYAGHLLYDPSVKPTLHDTFEGYKNGSKTALNHFHEKLLLIKERMNTDAGRKLAEPRHEAMVAYLQAFYKEIGMEWPFPP